MLMKQQKRLLALSTVLLLLPMSGYCGGDLLSSDKKAALSAHIAGHLLQKGASWAEQKMILPDVASDCSEQDKKSAIKKQQEAIELTRMQAHDPDPKVNVSAYLLAHRWAGGCISEEHAADLLQNLPKKLQELKRTELVEGLQPLDWFLMNAHTQLEDTFNPLTGKHLCKAARA